MSRKADSLIHTDGLLAVPYLPNCVPANELESSEPEKGGEMPERLKKNPLFSGPDLETIVGGDEVAALVKSASRDSAFIRCNYHSSLFLLMAGDGAQRPYTVYALAFHNDTEGRLYHVCASGDSDTVTVAVSSFPARLIAIAEEVADASIPSISYMQTEGMSTVILSLLAKEEPQVIVQPHALPYHIDPRPLAPDWADRYMPGRALFSSLVWGVAGAACGTDPRKDVFYLEDGAVESDR